MTVLDWLLEADPSIRWQVLRDLVGEDDEVVATERARVATEGWCARLLSLRDEDGQWAGGACFPADHDWGEAGGQPWTSTLHTLELLCALGLSPSSDQAVETISLVRDSCRWEHEGQPFFSGEVEACINGRTLAIGAYFGQDMDSVVDRLLSEQLTDGGWNCWTEHGSVRSSFHSTICVLEGLLAYERAAGSTGSSAVVDSRRRGEEYLLERALFRRLSTGEVVDTDWLQFSFPVRWHYDVLRGLDYFRAVGDSPDPRLGEAVGLLRSKQQPDGTWLLENTHPGDVHFDLEDGDGRPSRWNTLRALRVLRWHEPVHDPGPFYHGTKAELTSGDLLGPGYSSNFGGRRTASFVYLTASLDAATWGAELAVGEGPGRIYRVEPTGTLENDPNLTDQRFPGNPTRSYRTRDPLRVVGEVPDWAGHPPEALEEMRSHLAELKRRGVEAIDD